MRVLHLATHSFGPAAAPPPVAADVLWAAAVTTGNGPDGADTAGRGGLSARGGAL